MSRDYESTLMAEAQRLQREVRALRIGPRTGGDAADIGGELTLALSSARAGIWEWNLRTNHLWWSERTKKIFDLEASDFEGNYAGYVSRIHPQDRDRVTTTIQRAVDDAESGGLFEIEHRIVTRDGEIRWLYGSGAVLTEDGEPARMTGTVLDVTHLMNLQKKVGELQKMESIGRLAGGLAHDFNNLLTAIVAGAELALDHLHDDEALRKSLTEIRGAAERGGQLTQQLLSFARKQVLALAPVRVGEVARACEPLLARLVGAGVTVEIRCQDRGHVRADATQLRELLASLAENARDAMPRGGRLVIETTEMDVDSDGTPASPTPATRYVKLSVSDTGRGIAPADIDKIFEPFFTTKELGTGLGLASCFGIVSQLGGHITVTSEVGRGATFDIHLPLTEVVPGEALAATTADETIVVVDDDPNVRRVMTLALEHKGYQVLSAATAADALEHLQAHEGDVDLAICDVSLPDIDGVELARRLVAMRPELGLLFVTGCEDMTALEGRPASSRVLQKPFSVVDLWREVRRLLDDPS